MAAAHGHPTSTPPDRMVASDGAARTIASGPLLDRLPYPVRDVLRHSRDILGMVVGVGMALGIAMALIGVNSAMTDLYTREYRLSGADLRVIKQGGVLVSVLPGDSPGVMKHAGSLLTQIRALPGVTEAIGVMAGNLKRERPGPTRTDAPDELIAALGIDGDPRTIDGAITMDSGRWVARNDEIVVGPRLAREKRITLGQELRLSGRDFRVVGIGRTHGFAQREDSLGYVERESLRQRTAIGDVVNLIVVDTSQPALAKERIPMLDPLAVYDVPETVALAEATQAADVVSHWIIALLTLAIAALFVSNMLAGSVEARRIEFATLRAIGVTSGTVMMTVVLEAVAVCLAAWIVGVGVSTGIGIAIDTYIAPVLGEDSLYSADAALFLTVFALAVALGVVAGLGPARQATQVDPVEVLREA